MSAGAITAILGILSSLLGIWLWYIRRSRASTSDSDDIRAEIQTLETELARLRRAGDHAGADALMRRLRLALDADDPAEPDDRPE